MKSIEIAKNEEAYNHKLSNIMKPTTTSCQELWSLQPLIVKNYEAYNH